MKNLPGYTLAALTIATALLADSASTRDNELAATIQPRQLSPPKANRHDLPRRRFQDAKSFYTYYGAGKINELSHYDVAILHTPQMPEADVKQLSDLGVVTIGYITIGEDHKLQVGNAQGPEQKASWYFDQDKNGQADQDPIWKSWYANTNDPLWRANRVSEAKRLVDQYGFDGIFLDLISVSELYPECRGGMVEMLRELRAALPDAVIVMNQGFDIVAEVAPLVDGFMIESFTATYDFENQRYVLNDPASLDFHLHRARKVLNPAIEKHSVRVLVLDYAKPDDRNAIEHAANRAASLGYLFSVSPIFLDDVYPNVPAGVVDATWLQTYATPEKLAFKLPDARNGFPAGTVATPSGNFAGYSVQPIFNPATDPTRSHWSKAAWASGEDGEQAWLEIDFPEIRAVGTLTIAWHDPAGPSHEFSVQARENNSAPWCDVDSRSDNAQRVTAHTLPRKNYQQIRIVQPPDGGSAGRPRLMWIARLELTE